MIHTFPGENSAIFIEEAFRLGHAVQVLWSASTRARITAAMTMVAEYLAQFPPTPSFGGIDQLDADRQTLWVASTGFRKPLHNQRSDLARFDGDADGSERGLVALNQEPNVSKAIVELKQVLDDALEIAVTGVGLNEDLSSELFEKITVRYRAIRYAPVQRDVAGIGLHPDGNVLSALLTDQPGLVIKDYGNSCRPTPDGTVVMPGSILYRWSNSYFKPTFHSVEIRRGDTTKFTIVAFLNFPDQSLIPRSTRRRQSGCFLNDVQRCKEDDMNRAGELAALWNLLEQAESPARP